MYDIDGISEGNRNNPDERRDLLLQIIARNAGILHTHVIQIAYALSGLAKRTIEKELNNLEEDLLLESSKEGDSPNAIRRWKIRTPERDFETHGKREAQGLIGELDKHVTKLEKIYNNLDEVNKAWAITYLLQFLSIAQAIISVTEIDVNIKKERKRFDEIVNRTYNILKHEKRDYVDGRPVLRRLLHLRSSIPMYELNEFIQKLSKK